MAETTALRQLPRGRHGLSRSDVEVDQRLRIFVGMSDAMAERGYIGTPVAEIIKRAGVSRETFYQLYDDKLDAFLAAFDLVGEVLLDRLTGDLTPPGAPIERFERAIAAYLDTLATEPGYARLFLVEVYAAGPDALARRVVIQQRLADELADLFDARSDNGRFACQAIVAAVSSMVTGPIVTGEPDALRSLRRPMVDFVRQLLDAAILGDGGRTKRRA